MNEEGKLEARTPPSRDDIRTETPSLTPSPKKALSEGEECACREALKRIRTKLYRAVTGWSAAPTDWRGEITLIDAALAPPCECVENALMAATEDLRWKADMRAIKRWRAAGTDRALVLPDHTDLCVWLLEQDERLRADLNEALDALEPFRDSLFEASAMLDHIASVVAKHRPPAPDSTEGDGLAGAVSNPRPSPDDGQ